MKTRVGNEEAGVGRLYDCICIVCNDQAPERTSAAGIRRQALQNISNATTSTAESKKTPLIERDNYLGV